MAYEVRECRSCEGGTAWTIGNAPGDRREFSTCTRCGGSGEVETFVYEKART